MNAPFNQVLPENAEQVMRDGALAPALDKRRLALYLLQMALDIALILGSFALASSLYFGDPWGNRTGFAGQLLLPIYLTIALYNSTYSLSGLTDWEAAGARMAFALAVAAGLLAFVAFYTKSTATFSRVAFTLGIGFSFLTMLSARVVFTLWVKRRFGLSVINVLVIDDGGPDVRLPHAFHVKAADHGLSASLTDPHVLDRLGNYLRNMDRVIVSCPPERRGEWSLVLKGSGVHGEVISAVARDLGVIAVRHYDDQNLTAFVVSTGPLGMRARATKRLFDIVASGLGLMVLAPLLLAVALAIWATDGRPVLFVQRRLGRGNRFFRMYKFRTMRVEHSDADGDTSTARDDERVTRLGRFLRATSIDELPQLLNVLLGDMSMVGPRPHAIGSQAGDKLFWEVDRRYWQRHSLKPGLTGLAQVRGFRGATHAEQDLALRLRSDLEYLNGWSIWRDLKIVLQTLFVMVHERAF